MRNEEPFTEPTGGSANLQPVGFILSCIFVFCASAVATIYFCGSMSGGMGMPGGWTMSMMWMRMPGQTWMVSVAMFLLMWQTMMVAMMLPSALPMLVSYRRAQYRQGAAGIGVPTLMLAAGYFFVWLVTGTLVYAAGVVFALATMRSTDLSQAVPVLSGAALMISGGVQFTSWKMRGLRRCRDPRPCVTKRKPGKSHSA